MGKRQVNERPVILFQLYGFYVEVYYRVYRCTVDRLLTSDSTEILIPYLDQIYVRDLKKNGDPER